MFANISYNYQQMRIKISDIVKIANVTYYYFNIKVKSETVYRVG